jgi:hypothetical protein
VKLGEMKCSISAKDGERSSGRGGGVRRNCNRSKHLINGIARYWSGKVASCKVGELPAVGASKTHD